MEDSRSLQEGEGGQAVTMDANRSQRAWSQRGIEASYHQSLS